MKKILYGISGIGNGHSNREMPIIEELVKDCKVMIFAHDDSLRVMTNKFGENPNVTIVPVGLTFIVGSDTGLNFDATANSPQNQNVETFKTSFRALDKVISEWGKADLVITDYEPVSAQYAYAYKVPLVTVDQQSKFLYGDLPEKLGGFTYTDEVTRLSMFFPKVDKRVVCSFFRVNPREGAEEIMLVPPTIKNVISDLLDKRELEKDKTNVLVYISSAKEFPQTPKEIIGLFEKQSQVCFHLFVPKDQYENYEKVQGENTIIYPHGDPNFIKIMAKANGIISTAGHSLLSEAMFLSIPVYAIPIEPYEQHVNAWAIASNGFGVSETMLTGEKIAEFVENLPLYTRNIREDTKILNRGIGQEIIIDYLRENFLKDKKKVLVFSPPFSGHLNILKEFIKDNQKDFDFRVLITGWKNIPPDLSGIDPKIVKIIENSELKETDPALWTFPRVSETLDECIEFTKEFSPDKIIYDFFSLEGNLVGKILNIPYWCSVPAMIGPFLDMEYRDRKYEDAGNTEAIENIKNKWGIEILKEEVELVSDGFHLPGQVNLVWSFPELTRSDFKQNRSNDPYVFVGNLRGDNFEKNNFENDKPLIYFSFGTVVMNNLWNQQESTREKLTKFFEKLAVLMENMNYQVVFVTQGKKILEIIPNNWWVYDSVDQVETLSRADVFITHGGSNSFHEAAMQKVPMIVVPFFGDQLLVAEQVEELGLGVNTGGSASIDTHGSKDFLNDELAAKIVENIQTILKSTDYAKNYLYLDLKAYSIRSLLLGEIDAKEGDMIIGGGINSPKQSFVVEKKLHESFEVFVGRQTDESILKNKKIEFVASLYRVHVLIDDEKEISSETAWILGHEEYFKDGVSFYKHIHSTWVPCSFEETKQLFGFRSGEKSVKTTFNRVVVASESQLKIDAVKHAVGNNTDIVGINPNLKQDEQLIGIEEIIKATADRLSTVMNLEKGASLYVSTVSGLVHGLNQYTDIGLVMISDSLGRTAISKSAALALPLTSTQKAFVRGVEKFTVGKILGEEHGEHLFDADPHSLLTQGKIGRKELLAKAVSKAIKQLY